ncbi:MAG: SDR family NAD(P)-dependent oxidoreductase, partial [Flavobacteriales bacterium]
MANYLICGASRGIGFELVKTLLDSGHQIIAISRSVDSLEQLNHKNLGTLAIDLSEKQGFGKLKRLVEDFFDSSIDTVLYNAAALKSQDFEDSSLSDWKTTYNTNVFGAVQILQTCKPFLKPKAQVWLVSSMGAIQGSQKFA